MQISESVCKNTLWLKIEYENEKHN